MIITHYVVYDHKALVSRPPLFSVSDMCSSVAIVIKITAKNNLIQGLSMWCFRSIVRQGAQLLTEPREQDFAV